MTAISLPVFAPGLPAAEVDAALRQSLAACDRARECAVLWFAEVRRRGLFQALGHASLELYAVHALGFSRNRYWQFKRLADDLDRLPTLREAVADGRVGWTKAQQVARVATPVCEATWVERAEACGRRELTAAVTAEVARVRKIARQAATANVGGTAEIAFGPAAATMATPDQAIPASIALRGDALQVARFEALVEQARKRGLVPSQTGRLELVLAALERFVAGEARAAASHAPAQVIVHQCPDCAAATVTTAGGERPLAPAQVAALACDAHMAEEGRPNRATIPPRTRRAVLARDRHRCTTPGCGASSFLEVHHMVPRARGGSNRAGNLVTLCARCHAFAHRAGALAPAQAATTQVAAAQATARP